MDSRCGRALRCDALSAATRLPPAGDVQVPLRHLGDRSAAPADPARHRPDGERRALVGGDRLAALPAGRAREDHAHHLSRRIHAREARGAGTGAPQGLGSAPRHLGAGDARSAGDEGPRRRSSLLRDLPRDALHGDGAHRVRRRGPRPVSRRRRGGVEGDAPCAGPRDDLASSVDRAQDLLPALGAACARTARASSS